MDWIDADKKSHPDKEGWYLTLFKFDSGATLPIPLYYQFAWNIPGGIDGSIQFYTFIDNVPVELKDGRIF